MLSEFHKMLVYVFETSFKKQKPKIVSYRDYKRFDNEKLRESLKSYFNTVKIICIICIWKFSFATLDKMTPIKQKYIRSNQSSFMDKDIHKAIMTGTILRNRFLKEATQ